MMNRESKRGDIVMSGPKSSSYNLTPEQRQRILEEQRIQREREEELRRLEAETKKNMINEEEV